MSPRRPRFVYLTDQLTDGGRALFGWRLVAANHRPLGRAARTVRTLAECHELAEQVHRDLGAAEASVATASGRWSWRLAIAGTEVAVCVRPYLRRVECVRGMSQFRAAALIADPADGVVRTFGPNTLRAFEGER